MGFEWSCSKGGGKKMICQDRKTCFHFPGGNRPDVDIRVQADNVLKVIEGELEKAGSPIGKVLKVKI